MAVSATKRPRKRARSRKPAIPPIHRKSTVSQWGNSLGLRIPREAVERLQLKAGEAVTLEVNEDSITIRPNHRPRKWTLDELMRGVASQKVGEWPWGAPVGKEAW